MNDAEELNRIRRILKALDGLSGPSLRYVSERLDALIVQAQASSDGQMELPDA